MVKMQAIFLFIAIKIALSCWGGGGGGGGGNKAPPATTTPSIFLPNKKPGQMNWDAPPDMKSKWNTWYKNYQAQQKNYSDYEKNAKESDYTIDDPNIPESWKGLGPGRGPQEPPPWAVIPEDSGKPHVCYLVPTSLDCGNKTSSGPYMTWGYNWYLRQCAQFKYSGCGGNENNFRSKKRCEETCVNTGVSNCLLFGRRVNC